MPGTLIDTKKNRNEHLLEKFIFHDNEVTIDNYKEIESLSHEG